MLDGYLVGITVAALLMAVLSLLVFLRNPSAKLNRSFLFFSVLAIGWVYANYLGGTATVPHGIALIANRAVFIVGTGAIFALYTFVRQLTEDSVKKRGPNYDIWLWVLNLSAVLASCTSLVVRQIHVTKGTYAIEFGLGTGLVFAVICFDALLLLVALIKSRKVAKNRAKSQTNTLLFSLGTFIVAVLIANGVLPVALNYYGLTNLGGLFIFIVVAGMAYAITKHKLFDVRLVVARSLGYLLSLATIGVIFIGGAYALIGLLFHHTQVSANTERLIYTVLAVLLAYFFAPLKAFFDKVTSRLFYQDAYDPQELYAALNRALVSSLDVKYLMMQSISIVETALKPAFALVVLRDGEGSQRLFASRKTHLDQRATLRIQQLSTRIRHKVIMTDYLEGAKDAELRELLQASNITALVRLSQNVRSGDDGFGYLALGVKKSGNPYTSQDAQVLDTVANELIIAIQNALHFEEIQNFNLTLQARVDTATRRLRRTNERLKELDETKDDFISMASHQLRTPLTSVKGYLSMVLEGDAGRVNATQKKMLGQAFVSSQRMVYLIADLLNVSRLKTGKFVIEAAPTNLAAMVGEELDQLVETAAARDIELIYSKPKNFPDLMLDDTKTRQVIMNFADNAIYYTPAGGHIRVELATTNSSAELRVIDDGIGVPKAEQHHLFTKFYRARNAQKARPDGTGLGLFMAKKVILAQGGSVIFESKEGKGSTFGFSFPLNKAHIVPPLPVAKPPAEVPAEAAVK